MDVCADTTLQEIYDVLQVKTGLSAHAFHMKDGGGKKSGVCKVVYFEATRNKLHPISHTPAG